MVPERTAQPPPRSPVRLVAGALAIGSARLAQAVLLLSAIGALAMVRSDPSYANFAVGGAVGLLAIAANTRMRLEMVLWFGYVALFVVFAHLRGIADEGGMAHRIAYVIEAERALFFGHDPVVVLQEHARHTALDVAAIGTHLSYFVVPQVLAVVLLMRRHRMAVVYLGAVLATVYAGLLVCYLVPTAPPWLASHAGMMPPVERVLGEQILSVNDGAFNQGERLAGVNDVAAMPSLHAALPAVIAGLAWGAGTFRRWTAIVYCGLMGLSLVYLGEHYVVDVLAGVAIGLAAWFATAQLANAWKRHRVTGRSADGREPRLAEAPARVDDATSDP